ncbi:MAG: replication and repair protein RecF [Verrucomicrobiota bacterium]|jgi:DNA replication and repair protein RecF
MLEDIKLGHFRCFEHFEASFQPGLNLILGPNAHGKTSLLEAICVLLRLQSPRTPRLAEIIQHGARGLLVDGHACGKHLQFYFSPQRKKLALDSVEQSSASDYLLTERVVWFSNTDVEIVRGSAEQRRRFLDFLASQIRPDYRRALRDYDRALRSRNLLLKSPTSRWREISAFDPLLLSNGRQITLARSELLTALLPLAQLAHTAISTGREKFDALYRPGAGSPFPDSLEPARLEDLRLRQSTVGPHRDDWELSLSGHPAALGSEGQQRTLALALRLAAARLLEAHFGAPPLLLFDDIFGELDLARRSALLRELPANAQQIVTTTQIEWLPPGLHAPEIRLGPSPG